MTAASLAVSATETDVRYGTVESRLEGATASGVLWQAAPPARFLLTVPSVGRYLVEDGRTITVDQADGAEPGEVDRFLRSTPLAVIHLQRGTPVIHAAVVAPVVDGGGAIVLAGDSGTGKSVLAATLWGRGYRVLADDLAPVTVTNSAPVVQPTASELVLWPDAFERFSDGIRSTERRWHGGVAVYGTERQLRRIDVTDRWVAQPCPVQAIWWLGAHSSDDIEVREVRGASRFDSLGAMAANSRIASALLDRRAYLAVAGSLAGSAVPIRRVLRPRGRWCADDLADLVEGSYVS